ncbi:MAG: histidine kinase [Bacteroidales bacterium]|nr:histidine kinase [Bacteroidales bacterium]
MKRNSTAVPIALLLLLLATKIFSQVPDMAHGAAGTLYFRHFTKEDGLPSDVVRWVTQDASGYIWIATDNGLARYDGHSMKVFNHNPEDPFSLSDNMVLTIFESHDSLLWVGTNNGFSIYDPVLDVFTNYYPFASHKHQFPAVEVHYFFEDTDGSIWIATSNGLAHFDRKSDRITWMLQADEKSLPGESLLSWVYQVDAHPRNKDQIVASTQGGILFIDKKTHSVVMEPEKDAGHRPASQSLFFDGDSVLWTGEWGTGLKKLNLVTMEWEIFTTSEKDLLTILFIERKNDEELWLATVGEGLVVFNKETRTFRAYPKSDTNPRSLLSNYLQCNILIDKNGNLWVGGKEGLNFLDNAYRSFQRQVLPYGIETIRSIFRAESEDMLYLGTDSRHNIIFKDVKTGDWGFIKDSEGVKPNARIYSIFRDHKGVIWATSLRNHLLYLDPASQSLRVFHDGDNQFISFNDTTTFLREIVEDQNHNLWISAPRYGLIRIDKDRKTVRYLQHDPGDPGSLFKSRFYNDLMVDPKNRLWIGSYDGFGVYDIEAERFITEFPNGLKNLGIRDQTVQGFASDSLGRIWACIAGKGLLRITEVEDEISFKLFHTVHGLNDPNVSRIAQDLNHNFWIINEGLLFFNPYTEQFNAFDKRNGLHELKSHDDRIFIDWEDNIYLTGTGAYESQNISALNVSKNIINLIIEDIEVNGERIIQLGPGRHNASFILKPSERNVRLRFTAICFQDADRIQYEYQLLGYDDQKSITTAPGMANYTNLPPGKYRFVVKAAHRGLWFDQEAGVEFTIKPFFYQTAWFYIAAFLVGLLIIFGVFRYRVSRIRSQEKIKSDFEKKIAEVEMQSLRAQMNPHFIFNSLNSINTFILKNKTEAASDYLNKFARLIRAVLNNAKHKLVCLEDELDALKIYLELEQLRFDNRFDFSIKTDKFLDTNRVYVPPLLLQPYVENAVWHGLLHKETRGKIEVSAQKNGQHIIFKIQDNGVGRKKAAEFKSQFTPENKSVGMSITADRIAIIKSLYSSDAKISITDLHDHHHQPAGTKITIMLPLITTI